MFTGLIEDLGTVASVEQVPKGVRLSVHTRLGGLTRGASIAVDGVCSRRRPRRIGSRPT